MTVEIANFVAGFAVFTAANPPVLVASDNMNVASLSRGGAGVYQILMDRPGNVDANSALEITQSNVGAGAFADGSITPGAGTAPPTLDVLTFDAAGAPADTGGFVFVKVYRFPTVN